MGTMNEPHAQAFGDRTPAMSGYFQETTLQQLLLFSGNLQDTERSSGEYLRGFRTAGTLPPPADGDVRRLIERHELITTTETGEWQLRVPLMLRWMRKRG